ncbi:glycosyltransferase family 2 protein [Nostoc sp. UHCC 0870]|uniref:glycosyltransferase family 2 protein n=1 Tax=Nostoc sp. UHCC 0870 TaxID=2914041 RepID=UPI003FA5CF14
MVATNVETLQHLGVVVIGRNEGDRLRLSLLSVIQPLTTRQGIMPEHQYPIVYVDSGSTDGSVALAKSLGVEVVELDSQIPFTAARAYNAGCDRLLALYPHTQFVQFVDGDCIIVESWLEKAYAKLVCCPDIFLVCGRRREEFPTLTVFHRLCDMEWNTPLGETTECGGESMVRVSDFQSVGGFDTTLIAGEEPELCLRLLRAGGKIFRLDAETSIHDVQMVRWEQWWKRTLRGGYAFAEGAWRYRRTPERFCIRQSFRIWFWGLLLPLLSLATVVMTRGVSVLILLLAYGLLIARITFSTRQRFGLGNAIIYGLFCVLGKFPELQGQWEFIFYQLRQQQRLIVEYKLDQ